MAREFQVDIDMQTHKVMSLAPGTVDTDAVNLAQMTAAVADAPPGPQGPPGTAYMSAQWTFNQTTTAPPATGGLRYNATTTAATTVVYIAETDRDGLDRTAGLTAMVVGDQLMVQATQGRAVFNITSITDSGTYRTLGVTVAEVTGTRPAQGAISTVYSITTGGGSGGGGGLDQTTADARYVQLTGGTMTGDLTTTRVSLTNTVPTTANHAASKQYVDSKAPSATSMFLLMGA